MSYQPRELEPVYDPAQGYAHFVLYSEPKHGVVGAAWNGTVSIEQKSPYVTEWLGRLQPCKPDTLHTTLVPSDKIADLFHACVDDDKDSPAAVGGAGCLCFKTFMDPEFGLPVVADHFRTVGGNIDQWTYKAYAPLDLRPDDEFHRLIIDRQSGMFWIRTRDGLLSILPEENGRGYGSGYGGGGPSELARYITALLDSGGEETAAAGARRHGALPDSKVFAWVSSEAAARTQELSYEDLAAIRQG